jgi:hypothetical protein
MGWFDVMKRSPKAGSMPFDYWQRMSFFFFNYIDKCLIHLEYESIDQTNNRQTFAIVSWRHANAFFRDIEPVVIFFLSLYFSFYVRDFNINIRSRIVFWWMSSFYSIFFFYYGLQRRFQLNGRRLTSFRRCRSEGEWKWRRTIVQVERMGIREGYFNWFSSSNFTVLLSSSWLMRLKRKKDIIILRDQFSIVHITLSVVWEIGSYINDEINICHIFFFSS